MHIGNMYKRRRWEYLGQLLICRCTLRNGFQTGLYGLGYYRDSRYDVTSLLQIATSTVDLWRSYVDDAKALKQSLIHQKEIILFHI